MPAAASLTNASSTQAFVVPPGAIGFILWNMSAAVLRWRIAAEASASSTTEGVPIPAGSATDPKLVTHYFANKLNNEVSVFIYQASGGAITSGVGYEILKH